ncbi:hypothetical protein BGX20_009003 [Mortierella sp. AD010]|nr:hypothetical protein BGX20_009003 [Mortierella sp. AD010]
MAAAGILAGAAAVSVAFAVGTRKLYKAIIADKDVTLPSLGMLNHSLRESAYPDDFYPDLYSRGYSVGPPADHNPSLYVTQLTELLEHVGWRKCNLVGYSLGGAIVSCYSHQFPELVESLTFISPGGLLSPSDLPWVAKIFLLPYSAEILSKDPIKNYFSKKNIESMLSEFKGEVPHCIKQATEIMRLQFASHQGYPRGLMSTLKVFPLAGLDREFSTCQIHSYPVQAIWGTKDTVIPGTSITKLQKLVPRIKVTNVEGATHSIVMTHPTEIIDKLKDFVR